MVSMASFSSALVALLATMFLSLRQYSLIFLKNKRKNTTIMYMQHKQYKTNANRQHYPGVTFQYLYYLIKKINKISANTECECQLLNGNFMIIELLCKSTALITCSSWPICADIQYNRTLAHVILLNSCLWFRRVSWHLDIEDFAPNRLWLIIFILAWLWYISPWENILYALYYWTF